MSNNVDTQIIAIRNLVHNSELLEKIFYLFDKKVFVQYLQSKIEEYGLNKKDYLIVPELGLNGKSGPSIYINIYNYINNGHGRMVQNKLLHFSWHFILSQKNNSYIHIKGMKNNKSGLEKTKQVRSEIVAQPKENFVKENNIVEVEIKNMFNKDKIIFSLGDLITTDDFTPEMEILAKAVLDTLNFYINKEYIDSSKIKFNKINNVKSKMKQAIKQKNKSKTFKVNNKKQTRKVKKNKPALNGSSEFLNNI
jgi:hypothetical protein